MTNAPKSWPARRFSRSPVPEALFPPPRGDFAPDGYAKTAFTDALGIAVLVPAGVALFGAVFIFRLMPAHHLPEPEMGSPDPDGA